MSDIRVTPQPWLWKPRTKPIRFIEIHATRGGTTPEKQKSACLYWVQSVNNNNGGWGSSFSYVIGTDGSMGTVLDDNQMPTYSAGYGGPGSTYAIDEYGISYELAQSAAQEPFTEACYRRAAKEVAAKCKLYGIPAVFITVSNQSGNVPTGLVRHDRCQNGYVLGKSDPGNQFNEGKFLALVRAEMQEEEEDEMTPKQMQELKEFIAQRAPLVIYATPKGQQVAFGPYRVIVTSAQLRVLMKRPHVIINVTGTELKRLDIFPDVVNNVVRAASGTLNLVQTESGVAAVLGPYRVLLDPDWLGTLQRLPAKITRMTDKKLNKMQIFPVSTASGGVVGFSDADLLRIAKAVADEQHRRQKE